MAQYRLLLSGLAILAVAGCSEPSGTGFTGISSEAQSVSSTSMAAPAGPLASGQGAAQGYLNSDLPQITARSRSTNTHVQAEEAVLVAAGKNRLNTPVRVAGQDLKLSIVWVNQRPYAVLRPKSGNVGLREDSSTAIYSSIAGLTGCPPASGVYMVDKNRKKDGVSGMSVALSCRVG
ncbi:MAG: hypothetical protein ACWA5A_09940 [Marinibacterium sp.]